MRNPFRGNISITGLCPTQTFLCVVAGTLLAILVAVGVLVLLASPAHAGNRDLIRDRNGTVLGHVEKGYSGGGIDRRVVEDNRGRRLFSIERNNHRTIIRGADGSRIGRYTRDPGIDLDEESDDDE